MPYTKAQLRAYWTTNKALLNHQRREKRRLAKLGLAEKVSHAEVSHKKVSHNQVSHGEVSQVKKVSHLVKATKLAQVSQEEVSHSAPTANPAKVSHQRAYSKTANPPLADLIQAWQTGTNYACALTCLTAYCSNCWYFVGEQLVNYKGLTD